MLKLNPFFLFVVFVLSIALAIRCTKPEPVSKNHNVGPFNRILIAAPVLVHIYQANYNYVRVESDNNQVYSIQTKVENDKLIVSMQHKKDILDTSFLVVIQISDLKSIELTENARIICTSAINLKSTEIINRSKGEIILHGTIDNLFTNQPGDGTIDCKMMQSLNCTVNTNSSHNMYVWADSILNVTITGSGNVFYKGHPVINYKTTGEGKIFPFELASENERE